MGKQDRSPGRAADVIALQGQVYGVLVQLTSGFIDVCMHTCIHAHIHTHIYSCNSTIIPEFPMNWEIILFSENIVFQCRTFDYLNKTRNTSLWAL